VGGTGPRILFAIDWREGDHVQQGHVDQDNGLFDGSEQILACRMPMSILKRHPGQLDPPDVGLPEATQDDVKQVEDILLKLADQLEERSGGRFRLDRFRDVVWLMSTSSG
jgi:hypothetical protein